MIIKEWVKQEQGKHFCHCGCNHPIKIIPQYHKPAVGIPSFISGHQNRGKNNPNYKKHTSFETIQLMKDHLPDRRRENNPMFGVHRYGEDAPFYNKSHTEKTRNKMSIKKKNKPCLETTRKKISDGHIGKFKGEKHPNWKGGITKLQSQIRNSMFYNIWRKEVFQRDNYTCQKCGQVGEVLHAHHIKLFSKTLKEYNIKTLEEAESCKALWDINNGITLCKRHHKEKHFKKEEVC